jgi:pimeloyl-ACP methyl ester carboxylesterase
MSTPFQGAEEQSFYAHGLEWNVAVAGPESGPAVLLLHGFPEYWGTWMPQITALAGAGFRVYAPDMPGYGGTDEPDSYDLEELADCVADLRIQLDQDGVHLVGHDWGGMVGHAVAALHPNAVRSFVAASAPHPAVLSQGRADPAQVLRSRYVALFQIPGIEFVLSHKALLEKATAGARTKIDDAASMARALAYYRANLRPWSLSGKALGRITQPGLVIHAARDIAIGQPLMEATAEQFDDLRDFVVLDGHHFLQRSCTEEFDRTLLTFLRSVS